MSDTTPQLIVIAGPNGAGKSTLAPFLLRDALGLTEFVNADTLAAGLSAFRPERVAIEAGRIMLKRLHSLAEQRASFAFESTLASRSYPPWIRQLLEQGYEFHLMFLWLRDVEIAIERVKERVRLGGHDIPEAVIRRRYLAGIRNFFEFYQPIARSWLVYDNSDSTGPVQIARGMEAALPLLDKRDLWDTFCEIGGKG